MCRIFLQQISTTATIPFPLPRPPPPALWPSINSLGHVAVKGGTVEGGAMFYNAELSNMNVRLPGRKALLLKGTGDALVEPFKIKVRMCLYVCAVS